ncbi:hypothetical protein HOLleu_27963 [Holothuria leucospilota]|uniref:Uncharacterized protein n=1 Tax=Holothuria leucospilota TaxID=206669 RepID=A0A9Q1BRG0_HOLLE|nr:hypothetical protein HOLleu_27963 [Holothuria leucospilota]
MSNQGSENSLIISSAEENMTSNDCDTKSKQTLELETSEETKNKTSDDCDLNLKELPESESSKEVQVFE